MAARHDANGDRRDSRKVVDEARSCRELTTTGALAIPGASLLIAHDAGAPRCEKVRALRTELLLRREPDASADIMALVSPCAGEGRSLLAAELAIAFSQTGLGTLLVDADLRKPHQHVLFGTGNSHGLSQAIGSGMAPRIQAVHGLPQLSLLTAGPVPVNPLELLSGGVFAAMIQDWRETHDIVLIDTSPVMNFADGLAVANLAGRVLALSRARHTPYKSMQEMLRRLSATRSQVLGAVISHF